MHELHDAPPCAHVLFPVDPGAARRDARVSPNGRHLRHDQPRAADGPGAQVDQVPVVYCAVPRRVLAHRRHADPVRQHQLPQPEGGEDGRRRATVAGLSSDPQRRLVGGGAPAGLLFRLARHPAVHILDERRIALPQVLVGDAQASSQQREPELDRLQAHVALRVLEPLEAGLGGALKRLDSRAALGLVVGQRVAQDLVAVEGPGQRNGVQHRQAGAGADGKVGGVGGVAEKDDMGAGVAFRVRPRGRAVRSGPSGPARGADRGELAPTEAVADQRAARQLAGEEPGQERDRAGLVVHGHACPPPRAFRGLHDEGGVAGGVVLVGVDSPEAVFVLLEVEGERRKGPRGAQPDEAVGTTVGLRIEGVGEEPADGAVRAVGGDHQVGGLQVGRQVVHRRGEVQADAQVAATPMEDQKELPAGYAGEAVAGGLQPVASEVDVDVIPVVEARCNGGMGLGVGVGHLPERVVGEDDAEPEGVRGGVALEDLDVSSGVRLLEEDGGAEPPGPASDHIDPHGVPFTTASPTISCCISVVPS